MIEPLSAYLRKYLQDEKAFIKGLVNPVLLVEQRTEEQDEENEDSDYRFRTASAVDQLPTEAGEPLVVVVKKQAANAFQSRITVGRTSNNDVVLDDASVSRFHAWLEHDDDQWKVADAGSKNGTFLNGKRLAPKKLVPLVLEARLKFGAVPASFLSPKSLIALLKKQVGHR